MSTYYNSGWKGQQKYYENCPNGPSAVCGLCALGLQAVSRTPWQASMRLCRCSHQGGGGGKERTALLTFQFFAPCANSRFPSEGRASLSSVACAKCANSGGRQRKSK